MPHDSDETPCELQAGQTAKAAASRADPTTYGADPATYKVGYKRPPQATRFQKGKSGNPRGRKKPERVKDLRILFEDILSETVKVRDGGQVRTMTTLEAIFYVQRMKALQGDRRAIQTIMKLAKRGGGLSRKAPESGVVLTFAAGERGRIIRNYRRTFPAGEEGRNERTRRDQAARSRIAKVPGGQPARTKS